MLYVTNNFKLNRKKFSKHSSVKQEKNTSFQDEYRIKTRIEMRFTWVEPGTTHKPDLLDEQYSTKIQALCFLNK